PQNLLIGQGRLAGYLRALKQYKLNYDPNLVLPCDTMEQAEEKTIGFLNRFPDVEGIFAVNDSTAIGVMKMIQKMGKRIPQDVAVIGFGDGPNALIVSPPLSTVEQKGYEIGAEAVKLLINKIENETATDSFQTKVITPSLIVRGSTQK
ncbi:MAG TPA: substrate-binding domain-containing protein, partial [Bacteroidales bacterium]|nr:substrate-binding domain-containing protein [Bacteroidales bacterium]